MRLSSWLYVVLVLLAGTATARAQGWEFDARTIAIGGAGSEDSIASRVLAERRDYRVIVLPLGLIQVLRDFDTFDPDSDEFDLIKAIEYASSPLHYTFGRDSSEAETGRALVVDIRNATLSRDLNTYRGFVPRNQPAAEGLASPSWGGTIRVADDQAGTFHGVFLGAGPYLSMRTAVGIDERMIGILSADRDVYFPNGQFLLGNDTRGQAALALTGGYRGRFAVNSEFERDGIYAAADYLYLRGFRFEDVGTRLFLNTDSAGLLTFTPLTPAPLSLTRQRASSGNGFAIDLGVGAIVSGWEAGFAINGIANRITWNDVRQSTYTLGDLFGGNSAFVESPDLAVGDVRVELPVDYTIHGGYRTDGWSALAEYGRGFNGDRVRAGAEYRLGLIDLRGGVMRTREIWHPTGGIGLNFGPRVSLDLALFGTSANVQRVRRAALAASLRFNSR